MIPEIKKNISGLILCAGLSGRMGKFKPLLDFKENTFIQTIVKKLSNICNEIIIVTGYRAEDIKNNLSQIDGDKLCRFIINPDYKNDMFISLKTGLSSCNSKWVLYHFVDQPGLTEIFYSEFIDQVDDEADWIQPTLAGRKGHPIIFNNNVKEIILNDKSSNSLREISFSEKINKKFWECSHKEILQDIDTPEQYRDLTSG